MVSPTIAPWLGVLLLSVAFDVGATAYLKLAGDRIDGVGFFLASVLGVVAFAPSIVAFGYGLKLGPSYVATVGVWAVGVFTANALLGVGGVLAPVGGPPPPRRVAGWGAGGVR
jgi:hypothetical protein